MNWFVTLPKHHWDHACEHVENGAEVCTVTAERDGFSRGGCEGECHAQCAACVELEWAEPTRCFDCGKNFPLRDMLQWRWYDFYAPQGDEELPICEGCQVLPVHKNRVLTDRADERDEMYHNGAADWDEQY